MNTLKAVIVEDDVDVAQTLLGKLRHLVPTVEVVGMYHTVKDAVVGIRNGSAKVLFLDWSLSENTDSTASDLLRGLDTDPNAYWIVYTSGLKPTAEKVLAHQFVTLAWITKPYTNNDFIKLEETLRQKSKYVVFDALINKPEPALVFQVKKGTKYIQVDSDDFLYCYVDKNKKNVLTVVTKFEDIKTRVSLSSFLTYLLEVMGSEEKFNKQFYQPSQTFLINKHCISSYDEELVEVRFGPVEGLDRSSLQKREFVITKNFCMPS